MTPDTPLDRARALIARMTPGEWEATLCDDNTWMVNTPGEIICEGLASINDEDDAAGIVFSRNFTRSALSDEAVEAVARIIDPSSWRVMDSYLADMKRKYRGENAGYDPEAFKHKASMTIARAILAALVEMGGEKTDAT